MFHNRYRYTLISPYRKFKLETDPMGWEDTQTAIMRSHKTHGAFLTRSNSLEFTGKAKDFLEQAYQIGGVQAEVVLIKEVKHPKTDEWQLGYKGIFDFTTRKIKNNRLNIDVDEGGLREILASQIREKYELSRTESITGSPISAFKTDNLTITGREIYLLSKLNNENTTALSVNSGHWSAGYREAWRPLPLTIIANSNPENIVQPIEQYHPTKGHQEGTAGTKFFLLANRALGVTNLNINVSFTIKDVHEAYNPSGREMKVILRRYTKESEDNEFAFNGEDWGIINVGDPIANIGNSFSQSFSITFDPSIAEGINRGIEQGDSFGLYFWTRGSYGDLLGIEDGYMDVYLENYSASLTWEEDSFYKRTNSKFLTAFEVGKRLTEIYTGRPAFKSSLFESGKWAELGFTCGGWIRNLKRETEEGDMVEWPFTISFEEYYKSLHAVEPIAYGVVTRGNSQLIALEEIRYFFQRTTTIRIEDQVSEVERETAEEFIFASIATGYSKGGNYEKPLGLDEYNISTNYITPINRVNTKYEVLSPSRADAYAVEQARRMQYEDYPDEDTPYDKDNFLIDAKTLLRSNNKTHYEVRTWPDDFEQAPTGIYSPNTAFNLRLTPAHNRDRHSVMFNTGTVKTPDKSLRYTSSEGNSQLSTKMIGRADVKENADVFIKDLSRPMFEPEWVSFEVPFTQELLDQLQGHTKIGEELVNNYYGLVEFTNEQGLKEKGYLFDARIKTKEPVKITLLKAYE